VLSDKRGQKMQRLDLLMVVPGSDVLRRLDGLLSFECEFVEADHLFVPLFSIEFDSRREASGTGFSLFAIEFCSVGNIQNQTG
jgi:hypothetical protein